MATYRQLVAVHVTTRTAAALTGLSRATATRPAGSGNATEERP